MTNGTAFSVETRGDREIVMTRTFDAPRRLVFEAFTRPDLLKRWLGVFGDWSMATCEVDLRVGGAYRYVWQRPDGTTMGMGGEYREVVPPERLVASELFDEAWYPGEAQVTTLFEEQGGRTTVSMIVQYATRQARDGVFASGMAHGVEASYNALADVLAEAQRTTADR